MRKLVATEGEDIGDGRVLLANSLYVEDDLIPVCFAGDYGRLIGKAHDMVRDSLGKITFEIELFPDYAHLEDDIDSDFFEANVECSPFAEDFDNPGNILKARIRGIAIMVLPGFPRDLVVPGTVVPEKKAIE